MLRIEICISVIEIVWAVTLPNVGETFFGKLERFVNLFAQRRALATLTIIALAVIARIAVLPILPVSQPAVHDEFSYLLMADTFAHGRVANPTHPMSVFLETFHVNQVPTYVSKFYPAQGIFLAIGQVIFGHPFWGVVLSSALMCGSICWMLQGWMPPAWAFLGGLVAIMRFGLFSYWVDSYWGGAVTALGGALVLGALPRIKQGYRISDAIRMGVGIVLLFNSRPYESIFLLIPVAIALLAWMLRQRTPGFLTLFKRVVLPLGLMLSLTSVAMMFYFWRTTGNALQPPYIVNERTYFIAPPFPWLPVKPEPTYSSEALRNFYVNSQLEEYKLAVQHPLLTQFSRVIVFSLFYIGPTLSVPFLALAVALPFGAKLRDLSPEVRFLLLVCGACFAGMMLPVYFAAHYAAQLTCVVLALVLLSMRYLRAWKPKGRPVGIAIGRLVVVACCLLILARAGASSLKLSLTPPRFKTWASQNYSLPERAAIESKLKAAGGLHLIFARDGTDLNNFDWVYNHSDIDSSQIVWARDLGAAKNQELIKYFPSRHVWLVETETVSPKLTPYP
jgi:hypothetical protein